MERTDHEIIEFMKRHQDEKTILAMGELLMFMGLPDGGNMALAAMKELSDEKEHLSFLQRKYSDYLKNNKASNYISYQEFIKRLAAGDTRVL